MIRAAISRSACSASARRASAVARPVELVEQPGRPDRDGGLVGDRLEERRLSLSPQASRRLVKIVRLPNGPLSPMSGAAMTERTPDAADVAVRAEAVIGNRVSLT